MSNPVSLEHVPFNRFHRLLSLRSSGGSFVDGYVLSIIGIAMPSLVPALGVDSLWESLIAVSALIGIFVGGFVGGSLTDRFGRRALYFVGPVLFTLCSLLQLWVDSEAGLFILRLLIGVGIGFEYPVATAFLVEFLPNKARGPRLAALSIYFFAGAATAYMAGQALIEAGGADGWRYALASTAVVSGLLLLIRLGTPESPRWLISKGRRAEAELIIQRVYGRAFSLANLPEQPRPVRLSVRSLVRSGYGTRMLFVTTFWTCSVIPVFAVYAFAPKVLEALQLNAQWAAYGSMIITLMFVVGCLVATWLVNAMGRRPLLLHSLLWSGLALLLLGTFSAQGSWLTVSLFAAYAFLIGGAQVLQFIYPNEIFSTEIRAVAVGLGTSVSRIGAVIGTYLVPVSIQTIGIGHTLHVAALITFIGLAVSWLLAPETRGVELCKASSLAPGRAAGRGQASRTLGEAG